MNLIEFYENILKSVGLYITEDGYIKTGSTDDDIVVTIDGKPLVLPYKEHIDTLVDKDENGKLVSTKILFNPLKEDVIKGEPASLRKFKTVLETKLSFSIAMVMEMLLVVAKDKKLQKKASLRIKEFISLLSSVRTPHIRNVVDDKSITNWTKLYNKSRDSKVTDNILHIYLKKGGKLNGKKYHRVAISNFGLYQNLKELDSKHTNIYGIKLRYKDVQVLQIMHEFMFGDDNIKIGSNDKTAAGLVVTVKTMIKLGNIVNELLTELKYVNEEIYDLGYFNISITEDDLIDLHRYKPDLVLIPSDGEITRKTKRRRVPKREVVKEEQVDSHIADSNPLDRILKRNVNHQQQERYREEPQIEDDDPNRSVIDRILGRRTVPSGRVPTKELPTVGVREDRYRDPYYRDPYEYDRYREDPRYRDPYRYEQPLPTPNRPMARPMGINSIRPQPMPRPMARPIQNYPAARPHNNMGQVRRDKFGNIVDEFGHILEPNPNIRYR